MELLISIEKKKYLSIIKCSNQKKSVKRAPAAGNSSLSGKSGMSEYVLRLYPFLIWCFSLFNICLRNSKLGGAVHVKKGFLDMLKSQMRRKSYFEEFLLVEY